MLIINKCFLIFKGVDKVEIGYKFIENMKINLKSLLLS